MTPSPVASVSGPEVTVLPAPWEQMGLLHLQPCHSLCLWGLGLYRKPSASVP